MFRYTRLTLVFALLFGPGGCSKSEKAPAISKAPVEAPAETQTARTQSTGTQSATAAPSAEPQTITYRPVKARLRLSGEEIVVMVPDTMDIESGRMLEYREGDDGKYYLKSVIPN